MLTVSSQPIQKIEDLSVTARAVIGLIPQGESWVASQLQDKSTAYVYDNETELTVAVQLGLHGTPAVCLDNNNLMVSPRVLMTMSTVELKAIWDMEMESPGDAAAAIKSNEAIQNLHLLDADALDDVDLFLKESGVSEEPLFQSITLAERINVYRAIASISQVGFLAPAAQQNAARFALAYATSVDDFANYFRFYNLLAGGRGANLSPVTVNSEAVQLRQKLAAGLYHALRCPSFEAPAQPGQIKAQLKASSAYGTPGFASLSRAVVEVASAFTNEELIEEPIQDLTERYFKTATDMLLDLPLGPAVPNQAGTGFIYQAHQEDLGVLQFFQSARSGSLSIHTLRPAAGTHPAEIPRQETNQQGANPDMLAGLTASN